MHLQLEKYKDKHIFKAKIDCNRITYEEVCDKDPSYTNWNMISLQITKNLRSYGFGSMLILSCYDISRMNGFLFLTWKNVNYYEYVFTTCEQDTKYCSFLHDNVHGKEKKINSAWSTLMLIVLLLQPIHTRWYNNENEWKCKRS